MISLESLVLDIIESTNIDYSLLNWWDCWQ